MIYSTSRTQPFSPRILQQRMVVVHARKPPGAQQIPQRLTTFDINVDEELREIRSAQKKNCLVREIYPWPEYSGTLQLLGLRKLSIFQHKMKRTLDHMAGTLFWISHIISALGFVLIYNTSSPKGHPLLELWVLSIRKEIVFEYLVEMRKITPWAPGIVAGREFG